MAELHVRSEAINAQLAAILAELTAILDELKASVDGRGPVSEFMPIAAGPRGQSRARRNPSGVSHG